ncbi:MAG: Tat pathway signal sequence domain protein [Proteobacteria bacterium]|nr:Tat pathway signal sequence domain protein [Pseudomonadota bacterium]
MNLTARAASVLLLRRALFRRIRPVLSGAALVLAIAAGLGVPAPAGEPGIEIELNKVEDNGGSCLASFVVRNRLGHTLDRFSMDLYVFDSDGVIARQVLLDLAPLRGNKTTVLSFFLIERPCGEISRILINDIPSCRSEGTGETLDCLDGLSVSSRSPIEMVK